MTMVWIRADPYHETRFHRTTTCRQLRKRPASGEPRPLLEVDIHDVDVRPCLTCYPDAPRLKLTKRYCEVCDSKSPCQHNGGIKVTGRAGHRIWVWPDSPSMPYYRRTSIALTTAEG